MSADYVAQTKICRFSGQSFDVSAADLAFYNENCPVVGGKRFPLPPPTLAPLERFRRRLTFRNERYLYRNTSSVSGQPLISIYSPDKMLKICNRNEWLEKDNLELGREFDFSRPFFEQFGELYRDTYKASVVHSGEMVNSDYTHFAGGCKNCSLCFDLGNCEECLYCIDVGYCKDCVDCFAVVNSELCYDCSRIDQGYHLISSHRCKNCNFSAFLEDCIGCSHCIGCVNLRNKSYYIFNKSVSKAEYQRVWSQVFSRSREKLESFARRFLEHSLQYPRRAVHIVNSNNSSGDDLENCENTHDSFQCFECRNCRYCHNCYFGTESCYDVNNWGEDMEFCYELSGVGGRRGKTGVANCYFSSYIFYGGYDVLYSLSCIEKCQNLFGCSDLRRKDYCVLNKQYSKPDYEQLVQKIITHMLSTGEWGEFFPPSLSLFGYNESLADEYFPLSQEEAEARGASWSHFKGVTSGSAADALRCERSGTSFRVVKEESSFYEKFGLPLPHLCFSERQKDRVRRFNPRQLWTRRCDETGVEVQTSYSPERPEKIFCSEAFEKTLD